MTRFRAALIGLLAFVGLSGMPATAQSPNTDTYFVTPGGSGVNGALGMCLNSSNKAVPCSASGVLPSPVSGAATASTPAGAPNAVATANNPYPAGATAITASATGTTAATTATLAGAANATTYLCGFSIRANATAAATGNATVTGTVSGTLNFTQWAAPLASGIGITEPPIGPSCIPASAQNTAINVISAAPGSGGTVSVSAWGYRL